MAYPVLVATLQLQVQRAVTELHMQGGSFRKIVKKGLKLTVIKLGGITSLTLTPVHKFQGGARFWQVKHCICTMLNGSYTCTVSHFHFRSYLVALLFLYSVFRVLHIQCPNSCMCIWFSPFPEN